jgi:hypothetical protein
MAKQHAPSVAAVLTADGLAASDPVLIHSPQGMSWEAEQTLRLTRQHLLEAQAIAWKKQMAEGWMKRSIGGTATTFSSLVQELRANQQAVSVPSAQKDVSDFTDTLVAMSGRHLSALLEATNLRLAECAVQSVAPPPKPAPVKRGWFSR